MAYSDIIIDLNRLLGEYEPPTIRVQHVAEYPAACLAIREALRTGKGITLLVQDRSCAAWFTRLAEAYGDEHIHLRRYTARDLLSERWHVQIPPDINDYAILESGLLAEKAIARDGQSFWDAVVEHFYGAAFAYKTFPLSSLGALLAATDESSWRESARRPLIAKALNDRLAQWETSAGSEAVRMLIRRLGNAPAALRRDLSLYKLLQDYPHSLGEKVLGDSWTVFRKAQVDVDDITFSTQDLGWTPADVEYYLTEAASSMRDADALSNLIGQVSGYLMPEFNTVYKLVKKHPEWLTSELLRKIEHRFRPIQERVGGLLARLRKLLRPPFPVAPSPEWSAGEWLDWVQRSYMPYYTWLDYRNSRDATVSEYAGNFADWYYEHFLELKNSHQEHFAFSSLYQERERITEGDTITLILVLDNLNFAYFDDLRRLFDLQGLSLEDSRPVLSLIPTATEVSKGGVIAGRGDQVDLPTDRYAKLISEEWNPLLQVHGKQAAYLANIGELQTLSVLAQDVYFLNYLAIDKALHDDNRDTGRAHMDMVHDALQSVAQTVAEFAKRFQLERRLVVYVVSDHGSTRIPRDVENIVDKVFYKGIALDRLSKHHRYIALSDQKLAALPQVATAQCYIIDRTRFKTNRNYLAARQYYRFVETKENFYIHGGLSPEEVVVPFARFSMIPVTSSAPTVRLLGDQFRYEVKSKVLLEVGNPNAFPIEAVTIRLVNVRADEAVVDRIVAKHSVTLEVPAVFRKVSGPTIQTLIIRIQYEAQERAFGPEEYSFEVTMKSLIQETGDDFDL